MRESASVPRELAPAARVWEEDLEVLDPHFGVDDVPPPVETVLYAWQHTLVDVSPYVLPLVVARSVGYDDQASAYMISACLVMMGIFTFINTTWGHRLPSVMGPSATAEVSASVKAYFVLKLVGDAPAAPHMVNARERIRELGGVEACNSFTKIYLAIFGQYAWSRCPTVPPSLVLLPRWFPFNIYAMSSWSRAIVVPLGIISACKPHCPVPERAHIRELVSDKDANPWYTSTDHPAFQAAELTTGFIDQHRCILIIDHGQP